MIIVVGATGYIGRYFCVEMKNRGIDVLALGRSAGPMAFLEHHNVKTEYFDLNDPSCFSNLPTSDIDGIIDLSACLAEIETPVEDFFRINTIGAYRLLEFARKNGISKVVITTSHKVYNDLEKQIDIRECDGVSFTGSHTPYIISKIAAENFVEYFNKDFNMSAVALRLTGVRGYGEILGHLDADGTYTKSAFEIFFERVLQGEPIEVWGNQSIKRDHVYIKDVVEALYRSVISKEARGIYNIASGVAYSQLDEVNALIDVFSPEGKKSVVSLAPEKPGLQRGYSYSIEKAKTSFGWEPRYTDMHEMYSDYKREWISKEFHNYHVFKEGQEPLTI